jgi:hypothetical protein
MNLPEGYAYEGPFIKQIEHEIIAYDEKYISQCRTTEQMAYMRLGWLAANINYDVLRTFKVVDIGSGQGVMLPVLEKACAVVKNYDLSGPSISREELYSTKWDLVVLNDVLEHYTQIDELFDLQWRYALISFPETPDVATFEELTKWRHFRPNEHIYHLHQAGMYKWANKMGAHVINANNFEDILRTRWDHNRTNITTMLLKRN